MHGVDYKVIRQTYKAEISNEKKTQLTKTANALQRHFDLSVLHAEE